jgi:hypothetical protein
MLRVDLFRQTYVWLICIEYHDANVVGQYIVHVHVPLPGHKNDIKWDTLIRINSGTTASAQEETVPAYVDLPP